MTSDIKLVSYSSTINGQTYLRMSKTARFVIISFGMSVLKQMLQIAKEKRANSKCYDKYTLAYPNIK